MMDGFTVTQGVKRGVVFLTAEQAQAYGGYTAAALAFPAAIILPPALIEDYWADLGTPREVGHA